MDKKVFGKFSSAVLKELAYRGYQTYRDDGIKNKMLQDAIEEELEMRLEFAKHVVSLWSHAARADGIIQDEEDTAVADMIGTLFGDDSSLFPESTANVDAVMEDLSRIFTEPYDLETIGRFAKSGGRSLAVSLFGDACFIVASDGVMEDTEKKFLKELGKILNLDKDRQKEISTRYLR